MICSFATGNAIQSFTLSDHIYSEAVQILCTGHMLTIKHSVFSGFDLSIQQILNGIVISALVGLVIIGGIRRIGRVTGYLSPIMAVFI
jgi:alanine or glycine:cation symporter, AGCS family